MFSGGRSYLISEEGAALSGGDWGENRLSVFKTNGEMGPVSQGFFVRSTATADGGFFRFKMDLFPAGIPKDKVT